MSRLRTLGSSTWKALEWRESKLNWWHSIAFTLNICAPMLLGWLHYDARLGPLGGILGLLLSVSDAPGPLWQRLWNLVRSAGAFLLCGFIGTHVAGDSVPFWSLLLVLTFVAGWLSLTGRKVASAWRFGALALVAATATEGLGLPAVVILLFATTVCALTRTIGHLFVRDDSPVLPSPLPRQRPEFWVALRFCVIYALAVALGLIIGNWQGAERPLWIATTIILVMQPDPQMGFQRVVQRLLGTGIGVAGAALIVWSLHSSALLALAAGVIAFVLPHGSTRNYWLHSAFSAGLALVLIDVAISGQNFDSHLLSERIRDVVLGCIIVLGANFFAFSHLHRVESPGVASN